ncbi:MAG: TonB-dependent receptor [Candidatus Rokuibacteriota bacterium]
MIAGALLFVALLGGSVAWAQEPERPTRLEPVVVTVTRIEQRVSEVPASVTVLTREDIRQSASQTVDDLLRQVPGFSLFRRSSSLVTHPTTQGLSLRGIGPSGASRALVLLDGIPVNDPFGGWVYWNRIPLQAIEQIEVVRGGGSSVWGNYALGGVVHILTRRPTRRAAFLEASYGSQDTMNLDLLLTEAQGPLRLGLEVNNFETDGYPVVRRSRRGTIDINADSQHTSLNGRVELVPSPNASWFLTGNYYDEGRGNGTPLQSNRTESLALATGGRARTGDGSEWTVSLFSHFQDFHSTFSTQAANRNLETLALDQAVPSASVGASLQWSRRFGPHRASAGTDLRWIQGESDDNRFVATGFLANRVAGGEQFLLGAFVQDVLTPHPQWEVVGGVRGDFWLAYDGFRRDLPLGGIPVRQSFSDMDRLAVSPRLGVLFHATPSTDLRGSAYQGFRVPTINELYRTFRVRNDVTVGNEHLRPEQLTGGEIGVTQRWGPLEGRLTGFWNEVKDLVANVTSTTRFADCPVPTTCRQRQNLDLARIRGLEVELELRLAREWRLLASYIFSDTEVLEATEQRGLEGNRLAQVPEHGATVGVRYENPRWVNASLTARFVGGQFEDDLNTLPMGSYWVLDLLLSRPVGKWGEVYLGIENLLDETYSTGRTSEGVVSIGAPFLVRGGVRLAF